MPAIARHIQQIKDTLPSGVRLVAVSKTHPASLVQEAYEAGQRIFGESRPQELTQKAAHLPSDIEWHFIGHLQTNKVKQVVGLARLIHAVDSERLLLEIEKEAAKRALHVACLLQVHIAAEEAKFGFSPDELHHLFAQIFFSKTPHVQLAGLMGMATNTDDHKQVSREFRGLKHLFDQIKQTYFAGEASFCELSMGMSGDYRLAIDEGSTLVRIGTAIFGER
ncbi:MAG: YggS family pyridoxal phosphate-dependent enzyme [Prevotellaceae bacterium]|nr:YggS family pyridoxal phosphate-dependent enzyme [Prevotellaceae bacterium]